MPDIANTTLPSQVAPTNTNQTSLDFVRMAAILSNVASEVERENFKIKGGKNYETSKEKRLREKTDRAAEVGLQRNLEVQAANLAQEARRAIEHIEATLPRIYKLHQRQEFEKADKAARLAVDRVGKMEAALQGLKNHAAVEELGINQQTRDSLKAVQESIDKVSGEATELVKAIKETLKRNSKAASSRERRSNGPGSVQELVEILDTQYYTPLHSLLLKLMADDFTPNNAPPAESDEYQKWLNLLKKQNDYLEAYSQTFGERGSAFIANPSQEELDKLNAAQKVFLTDLVDKNNPYYNLVANFFDRNSDLVNSFYNGVEVRSDYIELDLYGYIFLNLIKSSVNQNPQNLRRPDLLETFTMYFENFRQLSPEGVRALIYPYTTTTTVTTTTTTSKATTSTKKPTSTSTQKPTETTIRTTPAEKNPWEMVRHESMPDSVKGLVISIFLIIGVVGLIVFTFDYDPDILTNAIGAVGEGVAIAAAAAGVAIAGLRRFGRNAVAIEPNRQAQEGREAEEIPLQQIQQEPAIEPDRNHEVREAWGAAADEEAIEAQPPTVAETSFGVGARDEDSSSELREYEDWQYPENNQAAPAQDSHVEAYLPGTVENSEDQPQPPHSLQSITTSEPLDTGRRGRGGPHKGAG